MSNPTTDIDESPVESTLPPKDGLLLSQVIAKVEQTQPVRAILEVTWDEDGVWEVEFVDTDNNSSGVLVDPLTGEVHPDDDSDDFEDEDEDEE